MKKTRHLDTLFHKINQILLEMSVNANFDSNTTSIKLYVLFIQRTKNTNIYVKLNRLIASNAIFIFELQYRRMTKNTK